MSRPLATIEAELKAARAEVRALVAEKNAAREAARPKTPEERREACRQRALASVRALPPMTPEERRLYAKFRDRLKYPRADALKAIGVIA